MHNLLQEQVNESYVSIKKITPVSLNQKLYINTWHIKINMLLYKTLQKSDKTKIMILKTSTISKRKMVFQVNVSRRVRRVNTATVSWRGGQRFAEG